MKLAWNEIVSILDQFFGIPQSNIVKVHKKTHEGKMHAYVFVKEACALSFERSTETLQIPSTCRDIAIATSKSARDDFTMLDNFVNALRVKLQDDDKIKSMLLSEKYIKSIKERVG